MNNIIKQINALNNIYHTMNKQYTILKKMFKNHANIKSKVVLSEQILQQAYMLIASTTEEIEQKRQFNKIIKDIKE